MRVTIAQLRHLLCEATKRITRPGGYRTGSVYTAKMLDTIDPNLWVPFFDKYRELMDIELSDVGVNVTFGVRGDPVETRRVELKTGSGNWLGPILAYVRVISDHEATYHLVADNGSQGIEYLQLPVSLSDFLACRSLDDLPEEVAAPVFAHAMMVAAEGW
jgi:hypothetical protein